MSYLGRSAKLSLKAQEKVSFLATAGQTSKTGLSYVVGFVEVILNGSTLTDVTDYTATDGNSITFLGDPLTLNDEVTVVSLKTFTVADHYTQAQADALLAAKATVANFTSTGIDDNATSTAITIDASENVLVGKTTDGLGSVGSELRADGRVYVTRDGAAPILINRLSSDGAVAEFYKDGTTVGSIGSVSGVTIGIDGGGARSGLQLNASSVDPRHNGSGAGSTIDLGRSDSAFKDLYLSGGVYLGGTDSPHKLDDYEEGTWTPRFRRSNGTWVNSTKTGTWQRIGNTVHIEAEVILASNLTGTGAYVRIGGLPFAVGSGNGNGMCVLRYASQSTVPSMKWVILTEGYIFVQGSGAGSEAYNYIDSGTQTGLFGMYTV